jgi:hypothetical protein
MPWKALVDPKGARSTGTPIDQACAEDLLIERAMLGALGKAEREQLAQLLTKLLADLKRPQLLAIEFRNDAFRRVRALAAAT